MKGMTLVTMILLIMTLVTFVGFLVHLLFNVTNESIKQRTSMSANEIAGVINMLQSSPSGTFHVIDLGNVLGKEDTRCFVSIDAESVIVGVKSKPTIPTAELTELAQSSKSGIIKTTLTVEPATLECKGGAYFMRCGDTVKTSKTKPCEV